MAITPKYILIVEDEQITALDIQTKLSNLNYKTSYVHTGKAAIESIEKQPPDLILMDIYLKGKIDGIETAEIINKTNEIPIIFLTAHTEDDLLQRVKQLNPAAYVVKPVQERELKAILEMAFASFEISTRLKESEQRYYNIFENAPDMYFIINKDGRVLNVNNFGVDCLGYEKEELINDSVWKIVHPDDRSEIKKQVEDIFNNKVSNSEIEFRKIKKDGSILWVQERIQLNHNNKNEPGELLIMCRDITRRKQVEEALKESRLLFTTFMDYLPGSVFIKNEKSEYLYSNYYFSKKLGIEKLNDPSKVANIHKTENKRDIEFDRLTLQKGPVEYIKETVNEANDISFFRVLKFPVPRSGKSPLIGGISLEVTDLFKAQKKLEQSEERLRLAIESAKEGTWDRNFKANEIYLSEHFKEIFGLQGKTNIPPDYLWENIIIDEDIDHAKETINKHLNGETEWYNTEYRIKSSDGDLRWILDKGRVVERDDQGKPLRMSGMVIDITESKRMHEALEQSEELLNAYTHSMPDDGFLFDEQGNIIKIFTSNNDFLEGSTEELVGKKVTDLMPNDIAGEILNTIHNTLETGKSNKYEYEYLTPSGVKWFEGITSNLKIRKNNKRLVVWVSRDITDRKNLERHLLSAKRIAERANRAKSEFLASMSHEIRTPMNNIIGMTDLTFETNLDEEQYEYMDIIKTSSHHLLDIINDILNLSKIEAGKVQLEHKPFVLTKPVTEVIQSLLPTANKKEIQLGYFIDQHIAGTINGDALHFKQILYNLLGNALKFTDEGGCILRVKLNEKPIKLTDLETSLLFSVEDTGIGIASAKHKSIFQPFSQAHIETTRKYGGTGLGLSITQKLVELMGGRIWLESEEGSGTIFFFELPYDTSVETIKKEESPKDTVTEETSETIDESLNLLIAEDNDLNQKLIVKLLKNRGHKCTLAEDGRETIEKLKEDTFDAIFMDIQMPGMNGIDATKRIRGSRDDGFDPDIPIVAVTAYAFDEDKHKFFDVGMNEFIPKPISNRKLDSVLSILKGIKKQKKKK